MPGNSSQFFKSLNDLFPKSTLGSIKYACSTPLLFSSYLLLASPLRTRFLIWFPNMFQIDNACTQNKYNNCTIVRSLELALSALFQTKDWTIWTNSLIMAG